METFDIIIAITKFAQNYPHARIYNIEAITRTEISIEYEYSNTERGRVHYDTETGSFIEIY